MNEPHPVHGIRTLLAADGDLSALVGGRIFCGQAPQDIPRPWIRLAKVTDEDLEALDGMTDGSIAEFDVHIVAATESDTAPIARRVKSVLRDFVGQAGDWTIDALWANPAGHRHGLHRPQAGEGQAWPETVLRYEMMGQFLAGI